MNTLMMILLFLLLLALFVRTVYRINQRTETSSNEEVLDLYEKIVPKIGDRITIDGNTYDVKLAEEHEIACEMCDADKYHGKSSKRPDCLKLKCCHIKKLYYKKV